MVSTEGIIKKLVEEITEHRQELKKVQEAFERYKTLFENIPVGIYRSTPDGKILKANFAMARMFGYDDPEELMKAGSYALYQDPKERDKLKEKAKALDVNEFEIPMKRKDGSIIWVRGQEKVIRDENGEVLFYDGFLEDITAQKKAEQEAEEVKKVMRDLTEKSDVGFYLVQDGVFKYVNERLAEIFGYDVDELLEKKGPEDLTHPEDWPWISKTIIRRLSGKVKFSHNEFRGIKKDGSVIYVSSFGNQTVYNGKPAIVGSLLDMTERKNQEIELKEREELYRVIIEATHDGIYIYRRDRFLFVNDRICEITGYSKEELYKINIFELIHPDDRERIKSYARDRERGKAVPFRYNAKILTKHGEVRIGEFSVRAVQYKGKHAVISFVRDVTERINLMNRIKEEKDRAERYIDVSGNLILVLDREGKIRLVNKEGCKILQCEKEEIIGEDWIERFIPPENREKVIEVFKNIVNGNIREFSQYENPIITAKGNKRIILWRNSIITDEKGNIREVISSGADITELKNTEEKLKNLIEEKDILLRELHHRVKNNLQIVTSLLRLQLRRIKDPRLQHVLKESEDRIVSIVLIHEKFYMSENLKEIRFEEYVKSLIKTIYRSHNVSEKKVRLKIEGDKLTLPIDAAIPAGLIINELVTNALKYAFPGDLKGSLEIRMSSDERDWVEIYVRDDGVGLPDSVDFDHPESLGFKLVKILAEGQLGGEVELVRKKKGTEFRIKFRRK
ncbi:MAG: PAS domain S-box protein [Candidatus Aminicenantes bacterium]|nr:PAS domain S-box protein [Candidatus Aminicenantes bacterium]